MRWRIFILRSTEKWFYLKKALLPLVNKWLLFFGFLSLAVVLYDLGFYIPELHARVLQSVYGYLFLFFGILYLIRLPYHAPPGSSIALFIVESVFAILLLVLADIQLLFKLIPNEGIPITGFLSSAGIGRIVLIAVFLIEFSRSSVMLFRMHLNPSLLYAGSFLLLILTGTGLLLLPRSTVDGIDFIDALFTSVSAVCVTGLIVVDTATHFTATGQAVILFLIQLGGLGVMVFTSFFGFFFQGTPGFQSRIMLKDFVNEDRLGDIYKTLLKIMLFALICETIGAILIFYSFSASDHETQARIWYAVFHSISAFCNAGFSVFTEGLYDAGMGARGNYQLHLVIAFLVILGGIGFPVVINYYNYVKYLLRNSYNRIFRARPFHHVPRVVNVNTRLVVYTSAVLIVSGTVLFWLFEKNHSLQGLSAFGQFTGAFFGAVTPRTAGFNTIDMGALSLSGIFLCIFLMWVGASPGSAGGGIKTSTFALAILNIYNIATGKEHTNLFGRQITDNSIRRAFGIIVMSVIVIGLASWTISQTDPFLPLRSVLFETVSAFSTVGLSLGITSQLSDIGKLVLVFTMFVGRIGTLTLLVAFFRKISGMNYRFPSEHIYIN